MEIKANEIREKNEELFIVVDGRGTDVFEKAFTTFEEAQNEAKEQWNHLTWREQKAYKNGKYHLYVCAILWNEDYLYEVDGEDASFSYRHSENFVKGAFDTADHSVYEDEYDDDDEGEE